MPTVRDVLIVGGGIGGLTAAIALARQGITLAQGAAMAIEDAVLLAGMLGQQGELSRTLDAFVDRRMLRCKLVMDVGLKMGEWEIAEWQGRRDPDTDHGSLLQHAMAQLMQPI
jgi:2-polyprenyl-6-methoxyphenol hydroxylase-like FAD-dependent oxidoreductase